MRQPVRRFSPGRPGLTHAGVSSRRAVEEEEGEEEEKRKVRERAWLRLVGGGGWTRAWSFEPTVWCSGEVPGLQAVEERG